MTDAADMQLVFRLGGMGFVLPIGDLVEIREAEALSPAEMGGDAGAAPEVFDLRPGFGLPAPEASGALLVLCSHHGAWALPVEGVVGIFPAADFTPLPMPELLRRAAPGPCRELVLWREEPLQVCTALELERFGRQG